jgi:hypothetical protein
VLFFIELGSRRVHLAGAARNPSGAWFTQQARNVAWWLPQPATTARVKGAITAVTPRAGLGGSASCVSPSPTWPFELCSVCSSRSRRGPELKDIELMVLRRELMSCAVGLAVRRFGLLIARFSLAPFVTCRARRPPCDWSRRGRCWVGTERSCVGSGARGAAGRAVHGSRARSSSSCFGSPWRTRAGAIAGSAGSSRSSACRHRRRVSADCLRGPSCAPRRGSRARAGESSSKRKRRASSRRTSSRSKAPSCAASYFPRKKWVR